MAVSFWGRWARLLIILGAALLVGCDFIDDDDDDNTAPVAVITVADADNNFLGSVIILDGSRSFDKHLDSLTYAWTLLTRPDGSAAELVDPFDAVASLTPDVPGVYEVELVVNDSLLDSEPATEALTVVIPPPMVTIATPEDYEVYGNEVTRVQFIGGVTPTDAVVTVNGELATNEAGSWITWVDVVEGENLVQVTATNEAGEGSVEQTVVISTADTPVVVITSHTGGFIDGPQLELAESPRDPDTGELTGTVEIEVSGIVKLPVPFPPPILQFQPPTVWVNGMPATSVKRALLHPGCLFGIGLNLTACYRFTGIIDAEPLKRLTIEVEAIDTNVASAPSGTASVSGNVDYCIKLASDGKAFYQADAGGRQNNRCHEIDGCSVYKETDDGVIIEAPFRNDPAKGLAVASLVTIPQNRNLRSTEFGSGVVPATEFYIHGNKPARSLPCNLHDQCYQTAGSSQADCDLYKMLVGTTNVCMAAYPFFCPILQIGPNCVDWAAEKRKCFRASNIYYLGDVVLGSESHEERQHEYTYVED